MGAVAGEVLADGDLEAAEAGEDDADPDRGRALADERRSTSATMPARTVSSASGNEPQGAGGRSSTLAGFLPLRSTAASRPANGHPEETLTRHQPISIPSGPRRGRECQWPQPGSPTSAREIRSHLYSAGASSIRSSSSRLRVSSSVALLQRRRAAAIRVGERVADPLQLAEAERPAARRATRRHAGVELQTREGLGEERAPARARGGRSGAAARPGRGARRHPREASVRVSRSSRSGIARLRV